MNVSEQYGPTLYKTSLAETDEFICGTEYEFEDVKSLSQLGFGGHSLHDKDPLWNGDIGVMRDGSLRNNGVEFVTRPVGFDAALKLFKEIHSLAHLGNNPYTERTSIHVHVNVASMDVEQVKQMVLAYALMEPVFFAYAGAKRKHNIHCVPLNFTLTPLYYKMSLSSMVDRWSKYTAFNLLPISQIGTVEFRHLYGTGDFEVYQTWLTMLKDLWTWAFAGNSMLPMLVENISIKEIRSIILPSSSNIIVDEAEFERSLMDVKLAY